MEHDLGYKSKVEVPRSIQRRFSRLAGLLEVADDEFEKIRDELTVYEDEVTEKVVSKVELVFIDKASLSAFVQTSLTLKEVDDAIAELAGSKLIFDSDYVDRLISQLLYFDLMTISDVEETLDNSRDLVVGLASSRLTPGEYETLTMGIGLFYLAYVLVARTRSIDDVAEYLEAFEIGDDDEEDRREFAATILGVLEDQKPSN